MSKIIYEFDTNDDREDIKIYSQCMQMYCVLSDLQDELRQVTKYGKPSKRDLYWRDRLIELLNERDVKL